MRGFVVAAALLAGSLAGCATTDPVEYPRTSRPYTWTPQRREPPPQAATSPPSRPAPRYKKSPYVKSWFPRGRPISRRWNTIVIHHSATDKGGATVFDRYHRRRGWDELAYHFVIGNGTDTPDGYVEVGPRWHKQKHGAHCKTPDNYYNEHGIGICLVGNFNETRPTPKQLESLRQLVRFLSDQCGIPTSQVTTHGAITRKTQCPGRHFPLSALRRSLSRPASATSLP